MRKFKQLEAHQLSVHMSIKAQRRQTKELLKRSRLCRKEPVRNGKEVNRVTL